MPLPADIHRCIGQGTAQGEPRLDCLDCARRKQGIADYMAGVRCWWMEPPTQQPCPEFMEERK